LHARCFKRWDFFYINVWYLSHFRCAWEEMVAFLLRVQNLLSTRRYQWRRWLKFGTFCSIPGDFLSYFHWQKCSIGLCTHASVILTPPFDSRTQISVEQRRFGNRGTYSVVSLYQATVRDISVSGHYSRSTSFQSLCLWLPCSCCCHIFLLSQLTTLTIHNSLSLSLPAQDLLFSQIFPTIDSLPASWTDSTALWLVRFFWASRFFYFSVFFICLFCLVPCGRLS